MNIQLNRSLLATALGAALALGAVGTSQAKERGHSERDARTAQQQQDEEALAKGKSDKSGKKAQPAVVDARAKAQADLDAKRLRAAADARVRANANAERDRTDARHRAESMTQRNLAKARADAEARAAARVAANSDRARTQAAADARARAIAEARRNAARDDDRPIVRSPTPTRGNNARNGGVPHGQIVSAERHARNDARKAEHRAEAIARERSRQVTYRSYLAERQRLAYQRTLDLRRANRLAQYRYQQQYYDRLRQMSLRDARYDWSRDPFFNSAPAYSYYRAGNTYEVNRYSRDLLEKAVRLGYQEGYNAGRADHSDNWRYSYRDSFAYQDANYGYPGYYVDRNEYNHYFREGFERGYEDGYYRRSQYGTNQQDGTMSLLSTVLALVLNMRSL